MNILAATYSIYIFRWKSNNYTNCTFCCFDAFEYFMNLWPNATNICRQFKEAARNYFKYATHAVTNSEVMKGTQA